MPTAKAAMPPPDPERSVPVSVVIPCYRCADTIGRALASVMAQTCPPAEVILVDDASGDGTLEELRRLSAQYGAERVRVVAMAENGGPGPARNAGWGTARQPLIAFLDADDAWHPQKLELQARWMQDHPEVAMCGHASAFGAPLTEIAVAEDPPARRIAGWEMLLSNRFPARSVMLRRDLPFRFRGKAHAEDYLLWLEIVFAGHPAWRLEAPLAFCFRPEFSRGGYSGRLWTHERRELNALSAILRQRKIGLAAYGLAVGWSLAKYLRRLAIAALRRPER